MQIECIVLYHAMGKPSLKDLKSIIVSYGKKYPITIDDIILQKKCSDWIAVCGFA
jgi:hypothetical protein